MQPATRKSMRRCARLLQLTSTKRELCHNDLRDSSEAKAKTSGKNRPTATFRASPIVPQIESQEWEYHAASRLANANRSGACDKNGTQRAASTGRHLLWIGRKVDLVKARRPTGIVDRNDVAKWDICGRIENYGHFWRDFSEFH